jgi:hypothetical protein
MTWEENVGSDTEIESITNQCFLRLKQRQKRPLCEEPWCERTSCKDEKRPSRGEQPWCEHKSLEHHA